VDLGNPVYSFHAGFLFDPLPEELGRPMQSRSLMPRPSGLELFLERVNALGRRATQLGVELLIENNVLSAANLSSFKTNPFLMVDIEETRYIMENTPGNVNLLVDLGHLSVSARALGFNKSRFLAELQHWIKGYHFSDNDGLSDTNMPVTEVSWFWHHLKKNISYLSLEIYHSSFQELQNQKDLLLTTMQVDQA